MADRTVTVAPTGGTYSTLSAAIAGEVAANPNLTVDNGSGGAGVLNIKIQGDWSSGNDTTLVAIDGFTTSATCYLKIYTDSSNRASASGLSDARYHLAVSNNIPLVVQDNYVWIDGLQISTPAINSTLNHLCHILLQTTPNWVRISNCRFKGAADATYYQYGILADAILSNVYVWNTIIENLGSASGGGIVGRAYYSLNSATMAVYNSLAYNCYSSGFRKASGTLAATNCVVFNCGDDFLGTITIDYCASDDGDGTHDVAETGGGASWTGDFTAATTGDFSLKSGSGLAGFGLSDPGSGLFSDDIDGHSRGAAWDVGPFQFTTYKAMVVSFRALKPTVGFRMRE